MRILVRNKNRQWSTTIYCIHCFYFWIIPNFIDSSNFWWPTPLLKYLNQFKSKRLMDWSIPRVVSHYSYHTNNKNVISLCIVLSIHHTQITTITITAAAGAATAATTTATTTNSLPVPAHTHRHPNQYEISDNQYTVLFAKRCQWCKRRRGVLFCE